MLVKKISIGLLALSAAYTPSIYANTPTQTKVAPEIIINLFPKQSQDFFNFTAQVIKGRCTVTTQEPTVPITAKILSEYGIVNGKRINKGETYKTELKNKDILNITAVSRAKVRLTNLGKKAISARCVLLS